MTHRPILWHATLRSLVGSLLGTLLALALVACDDAGSRPDDLDGADDALLDTAAPDTDDTLDPPDTTVAPDGDADTSPVAACGFSTCAAGQLCCDGECVDPATDPLHCGACGQGCGDGAACAEGRCLCGDRACVSGQACCAAGQASLCTDLRVDPVHCGACGNACAAPEICAGGQCYCAVADGSFEACGDEQRCCPATGCVDLDSDPLNCGGCGLECGSGEICVGGLCSCGNSAAPGSGQSACGDDAYCCGAPAACQPRASKLCDCGTVACAAGQLCCPGDGGPSCASTQADPDHCGACGVACGAGQSCNNGQCVCQQGVSDCDEDPTNGCETQLSTHSGSCGTCGASCPTGQVCDGTASCAPTCQPGLTLCVGDCVDLASAPGHCGACANVCPDGTRCDAGQCVIDCQHGTTQCDGACVATDYDWRHCGGCNQLCPPGEVCTDGRCELTCQTGRTECAGSCIDLDTDRRHCGACGNLCPPGQVCNGAGSCALSCQIGLTDCNGQCIDLDSNRLHCGACGASCPPGAHCQGGQCRSVCTAPLADCSGDCVDLTSDPLHCGACGAGCGPLAICTGAACTCLDGAGDCNADAADGCETILTGNRDHCGACGNRCLARELCAVDRCECPLGLDCRISAVAVSDTHLCAQVGTDELWCQGHNTHGQLGDGTTTDADGLVEASAAMATVASPLIDVAVGRGFTCVLADAAAGARVWCWGDNTRGQLGNGSTTSTSTPTPLPVLDGATTIVARGEHACAVVATELWCWGANDHGSLGLGDTNDRLEPTRVTGMIDVVEVALGAHHTCARLRDDSLWCWGRNDSGELARALGDTTPAVLDTTTPGPVALGDPTFVAVDLAIGGPRTCAVSDDGRALCWGVTADLGLGVGTAELVIARDGSGRPLSTPAEVIDETGVSLDGVTAITLGARHGCVLRTAGGAPADEVWCWGDNANASLGTGCTSDAWCPPLASARPVTLDPIRTLVAGGSRHTCGQDATGLLRCWGPEVSPAPMASTTPLLVPGLSGVVELSAWDHTCARVGEVVSCWGFEHEPEFVATSSTLPAHTTLRAAPDGYLPATVFAFGEAAAFDLGGDGGCLIDGFHSGAKCWPTDSQSDGTAVLFEAPQTAFSLNGDPFGGSPGAAAVDIARGPRGRCAITGTGQARCEAEGVAELASTGLDGTAGNDAVAIDVGDGHACAIRDDGAVLCWGDDQLVGTVLESSASAPVTGIDGVSASASALALGSHHACAVVDGGAVRCWGLDDDGQLGNGDGATSGSVTPAAVAQLGAALPAARAVFAGEATSCAILTDDTVACWGRRLGAAGSDDAPALVAGLSDIETLAIGRDHACAATRTTGEVYCWGDNRHHALGVTTVSPPSTVLSLPAP